MCPDLLPSRESIMCLCSKAMPGSQCDCDIINPSQAEMFTINYSKHRSSKQTKVGKIESPMTCISLVEYHTDFIFCSGACDSWQVMSHLWTCVLTCGMRALDFAISRGGLVRKAQLEPEDAASPSWPELTAQ